MCILVTEDNMKNPQFPEMLTLLTELKTLKIDNVKISLGRLQVKVYWRQKNKHRVKEKDIICINWIPCHKQILE